MMAGIGERERVLAGLGEGARGLGWGEGLRDDFADAFADGGRRTWSGGGRRRSYGIY